MWQSGETHRDEIVLKCRTVPGASSYIFEFTPAPVTAQSQWQQLFTTKSKTVFRGLTSGQEYYFRIAAIGPKNQLVYSQEVSKVAL